MLLASAVVVWEWLNEHGRWRPYSPAVSHHIEAVVRAGPAPGGSVVLGQVDGRLAPYIIDLQSMNQFRQDTDAPFAKSTDAADTGELLRKYLPESLKVYGTVFHMNQGNPFKLKALVDKWPDFSTVVVHPQEQEMADDLDPYTNSYQIYSKDPKNCQEFLGLSEVINWKQHFQIQSTQSSLDEVIQSLSSDKLVKVKRTQYILNMMPQTAKRLVPFLVEDTESLHRQSGRPRAINQEMFKLSSLNVIHAALVDKFWHFGGNARSQRFIERCIQIFPSSCLLGPDGTPVSWALMDQTGEMRMAGTVPDYRAQGLISYVIYTQTLAMDELGYPV